MSKKDFIKLDKDIERLMKKSEKNLFKGYKESLDYLKKEMADLYEKYGVGGKLTDTEMLKYNRMVALEKDIAITVKLLYERNNKEITSTLRKSFIDTSKSIVSIVEKDIGRTLKPITKAVDVNRTINQSMKGLHWGDRQSKHRNDLIYDIGKTVKEGLSNGETYSTMAKRLNKEMDISMRKATTIARTETSRVVNQTQKDTLDKVDKAGVKMLKTWNSVSDERVRYSHDVMDGVTIPYDEEFVLPSGFKGHGPKLLDDDGSESINCRCFISVSFEK